MTVVKKHHLLLLALLLIFGLAVRLVFWVDGTIPFAFDHGKDSLATMYMVVTRSPAFIGPWTSIPGLYNGPGWYYLLAPALWIAGFNPVASVAVMTVLVLIQIYLASKYFGWFEALIIATAPFWIHISISAWNPFPMTLVSLLMLRTLFQIMEKKEVTRKQAGWLGLLTGIGFYFSAAFAIYYPFIFGSIFWLKRCKVSLASIGWAAVGVIVPFLPQLAFEVKHNFVETRAVLAYFAQGESHVLSYEKVVLVIRTVLGETQNAVLPALAGMLEPVHKVIQLLLIGALICIAVIQYKKSAELRDRVVLTVIFTTIPIIGYFFLHFNVWYIYAIMPVWVLLVAEVLRRAPKFAQVIFVCLFLLSPVFRINQYLNGNRQELRESNVFLPVKLKAIETIREKASGRPFASYHFHSDIYDFAYQYLYFMQALAGKELPTEFSYKPGESIYVVQKPALLAAVGTEPNRTPAVIFYVVEQTANTELLERWWGDQVYGEITETIELSPKVTLYVATPRSTVTTAQ